MAKVLFVDDYSDTADSLASIAAALGHEPAVAYDGETALRITSGTVFDLIFLDVGLRDADGRDIGRQIRKGPSGAARMIAVTGHAHLQDGDDMDAFDACLLKPIGMDQLERLLLQE